jgi:hypothetical protein
MPAYLGSFLVIMVYRQSAPLTLGLATSVADTSLPLVEEFVYGSGDLIDLFNPLAVGGF